MSDEQDRNEFPLDHIIARRTLVGFVLALVAATALLMVIGGPVELAVGKAIWAAVRRWALPW